MALMDFETIEWWTFDLVREALVEVTVLWHRSPGSGRWPFAADGPWHLIVKDNQAGDYDARGGFGSSSDVPIKPLPLRREEVDRRDAVSEWLRFVPNPADRRLLATCLEFYARGYKQLPWKQIKLIMKVDRGEAGLRKRFERSIAVIAEKLNAAEKRECNVSRVGM